MRLLAVGALAIVLIGCGGGRVQVDRADPTTMRRLIA